MQHQPQVRSNLVLFFLAKSLGLISIPRGLCVSGHVIWESFASDKSPKCTLNALDEKAWEDAAQRGREWGDRGLFTGRNAQHMTFSSNVQNEHFCYPQRHMTRDNPKDFLPYPGENASKSKLHTAFMSSFVRSSRCLPRTCYFPFSIFCICINPLIISKKYCHEVG